jgi:hypothetical protein
MAFDEEAIQAALYARLSGTDSFGVGVAGLNFTSRNYYDWDKPGLVQPAMLVCGMRATGQRKFGTPAIWTMHAMVVFYARAPSDEKQSVETTLFGFIKSLDASLKRQRGEAPADGDPSTTLGGLVSRCFRTDYEIFHGSGDAGGQAAATMSIELIVPDSLP